MLSEKFENLKEVNRQVLKVVQKTIVWITSSYLIYCSIAIIADSNIKEI